MLGASPPLSWIITCSLTAGRFPECQSPVQRPRPCYLMPCCRTALGSPGSTTWSWSFLWTRSSSMCPWAFLWCWFAWPSPARSPWVSCSASKLLLFHSNAAFVLPFIRLRINESLHSSPCRGFYATLEFTAYLFCCVCPELLHDVSSLIGLRALYESHQGKFVWAIHQTNKQKLTCNNRKIWWKKGEKMWSGVKKDSKKKTQLS